MDASFIGNICGALLVSGYGAARLISYMKVKRKTGPNPRSCPDPGCHSQVVNTAWQVAAIKKTINETMFPKINKTAEDVKYIRGWIEGLRNGKET